MFVDFKENHLLPLDGAVVLISGATGMVGGYLARSLLESSERLGIGPAKLILLGRNPPHRASLVHTIVNHPLVDLRISDLTSAPRNLPKVDICIHAASPAAPAIFQSDPVQTFKINVSGLQNLIEGPHFSTGSKFLLVSSGEVYGNQQPQGVSEDFIGGVLTTDPRSIYAESKRAAEALLVAYGATLGFTPTIARLFHTFGPGVREGDTRIFGSLLWNAAKGEPLNIRSDGTAVRSFLDLSDAVRGLIDVVNHGMSGSAYNIGSPVGIRIREFVEMIQELFPTNHPEIEFDTLPSIDNYAVLPSVDKLTALGWSPSVSLPETITKTIGWIRNTISSTNASTD
jgi:UDP-glucuronate decarboxylase